MIKFVKNIVLHSLSSIEYHISLLVVALGLLFTIVQYADMEYSLMIFSSLTNKTFIVVILLPCLVLIIFKVLNYINHNHSLILKLNNKTSLVNNTIISLIVLTLIFFLEVIIISLIITNITSHQDFSLTTVFTCGCYDIIIMVIEIIKLYLVLVLFSLISMFLYYYLKKKSLSILFITLLIILVFFLQDLITGNIFIDTFNPTFHFLGHHYTNSIMELILSGVLFFSLTYSILIFLVKEKIKKEDIGI